jgi:hypothetical protein
VIFFTVKSSRGWVWWGAVGSGLVQSKLTILMGH